MTVVGIGISYGLATLFAMFSGMPIAFALGAVALTVRQKPRNRSLFSGA